mmetsp:Transcript_30914/g.99742  ORF Transcript_30914/g.99742 Transcript_30914/m.99742 type:complete len:215 (-) Transcript_30914:161-805(-)
MASLQLRCLSKRFDDAVGVLEDVIIFTNEPLDGFFWVMRGALGARHAAAVGAAAVVSALPARVVMKDRRWLNTDLHRLSERHRRRVASAKAPAAGERPSIRFVFGKSPNGVTSVVFGFCEPYKAQFTAEFSFTPMVVVNEVARVLPGAALEARKVKIVALGGYFFVFIVDLAAAVALSGRFRRQKYRFFSVFFSVIQAALRFDSSPRVGWAHNL